MYGINIVTRLRWMRLAIEGVAIDRTFPKLCWQGYKGILSRYEHPIADNRSSFTHSYACPLATSPAVRRWLSKANEIVAHNQGQLSRRRSKRRLTFITSPRSRGNETSSPGKASRPFPLRYAVLRNRGKGLAYARLSKVWLHSSVTVPNWGWICGVCWWSCLW